MIYSLKHWQKLAIALAGMETHGVKTTTITELGEICLWNFLRHAALLVNNESPDIYINETVSLTEYIPAGTITIDQIVKGEECVLI